MLRIQKANHGWNVIHDLLVYPFTTYASAVHLYYNASLLEKFGLLQNLHSFSLKGKPADFVFYSVDSHALNEKMIRKLVEEARSKLLGLARKRALFFPLYAINPFGSRTGRIPSLPQTAAGYHHSMPTSFADAVAKASNKVYNERYAPAGQESPNQQATPAATGGTCLAKEVATEIAKDTVVESIDPRKLPLFHYVNADLLPDPPKDDMDVSTEACHKRQAKTIGGLLADLRQRTEDLTQERTAHANTIETAKRLSERAVGLSGEIRFLQQANTRLRDNTERIALVLYSRRDLEWHLVLNGIAYRFRDTDTFVSLAAVANSINAGKSSISDFALIRKPYYYKEEYA